MNMILGDGLTDCIFVKQAMLEEVMLVYYYYKDYHMQCCKRSCRSITITKTTIHNVTRSPQAMLQKVMSVYYYYKDCHRQCYKRSYRSINITRITTGNVTRGHIGLLLLQGLPRPMLSKCFRDLRYFELLSIYH